MNWILAAGAAPQGGGGTLSFLYILPWLIFIFLFYYMFVARPMKQKQKQFRELMAGMKPGDHVSTTSGIFGVVTGITDKSIKVRIANNVVVEMEKTAISGIVKEEGKEEKK